MTVSILYISDEVYVKYKIWKDGGRIYTLRYVTIVSDKEYFERFICFWWWMERSDQVSEKDYIKQIAEMAWLLRKEDLKFIRQIYTMMYHYIKKRKS